MAFLNAIFAQKTEIIHQSGFKHDYLVARAAYLEDLKDTATSKYIATLKVSCKDHPGSVVGVVTLIGIRAKELGGNVFFLNSYTVADSSLTMIVKVYFAFKRVLDNNEKSKLKEMIVVFNGVKEPGYYQCFLLNDSLKCFNTNSTFEFTPLPGKKYTVKTCSGPQFHVIFTSVGGVPLPIVIPRQTKLKIKHKQGAQTVFIGLYSSGLLKKEQIDPKGKMRVARSGLEEIGYREGRLLLEIMRSKS